MIRRLRLFSRVLLGLLWVVGLPARAAETSVEAEVCVYAATPSGILAAVAVRRDGRTVVIVEPSRWVGGILGAGLKPMQDCPNYHATGGLTKELLRTLGHPDWPDGEVGDGKPALAKMSPKDVREDFAALLEKWDVRVIHDHRIARCEKNGTTIAAAVFDRAPFDALSCPVAEPAERGSLRVTAKVFIDASYEGDLMAKAGVSYRVGREAAAEYGEQYAGVQPPMEAAPIDPFVVPGQPESGLLKWVEKDHGKPVGAADGYTQAYNYRYNRAKRVNDPVCLAQYGIDTYPARRIWYERDGQVWVGLEGNMFVGGSRGPTNVPYPIPYRALTPKAEECDNLLVSVSFSATHLGYASARMEPVFMMCGESAGIAACRALAERTTVQGIDRVTYRAALQKAGQKLSWDAAEDVGPAKDGLSMDRLLKEGDRDGDKLLSKTEWEAAKKGWEWLFPVIDTDGDGRINAAEYKAFQAYKARNPDWMKRKPKDPPRPSAVHWVRAGLNTNVAVWGIQGGLLWGLPSGKRPPDGPRGLIRLWSPVLTNDQHDLINFIAIEPVVGGRRGFSELERSALDGVPGKRLWAVPVGDPTAPSADRYPSRLRRLDSGAQELAVRVEVEHFENGAHVVLTLTHRSDLPDEVELAVSAKPASAPMEYCILTATMGNKARTRLLWLKDGPVSSLTLYPNYREPDFAPHHFFALDRLHRTASGNVLAAISTDETNPSAVDPLPAPRHWRYRGLPVTQYWRKPAGTWRDDLQVAVNGRFTYWRSRHPIPGGIAFENFELRERFHAGQRSVFGITRQTPAELGFLPRR